MVSGNPVTFYKKFIVTQREAERDISYYYYNYKMLERDFN